MRTTKCMLLSACLAVFARAAPAEAQSLYWAAENGIFRKSLPDGAQETLIRKNHLPLANDVAVDAQAGKLYWTSSAPRAIARSDLDGNNVETLIEFETNPPSGIALDTLNGKMYFVRRTLTLPGLIQRANLDGTNVEDLVVADLPAPGWIALDVAGGKMYFTDSRLDAVLRANLDGSAMETLIDEGLLGPKGIALDLLHGKIYWTDSTNLSGTVERSNLDGTGREILVPFSDISPTGITVDPIGGKIYWMNDGFPDKSIRSANLDGSEQEVFLSGLSLRSHVSGIDFHPTERRLYWAHRGDKTVYSTSVDKRDMTSLFPNVIWNPLALRLDRVANHFLWADQPGNVWRASASGEDATTLSGLSVNAISSVDPSSQQIYFVNRSGRESLLRATLNGSQVGEIKELYQLTFSSNGGASGTVGTDLLRGHVYHAFVEYPSIGKIRRAGTDGSNPVELVVLDMWAQRMSGMTVDVLNEKLYWWTQFSGHFQDTLFRSSLDGTNLETVDEISWVGGTFGLPSVVVAPWENAVYYAHPAAPSIYRMDLSDMTVDAVAQASAAGLDIDACPPVERTQTETWGALLTDCLHGPAMPLPAGCACADLTGEGLVDLRDVSAFMLYFDQ